MRFVKDHLVTGDDNPQVEILVYDEPGAGGASHHYGLHWGPVEQPTPRTYVTQGVRIEFQDGPINEAGINGVTQEALLAIVIDRLRSFQAGPFSCRANAIALTKCEEALMWLHLRTKDRMLRGVEGQTKA